jgi:hypothetical protein
MESDIGEGKVVGHWNEREIWLQPIGRGANSSHIEMREVHKGSSQMDAGGHEYYLLKALRMQNLA